MGEERISPLRQRMIEDMRIRGMGEKAQAAHIRAIRDFAAFLGHSPDTATPEELRAYQLHMTDTGVTPSTFNVRIVALRFFFGITCGRGEMKRFMQFRTEPRKLPVVFSVEEVSDILMAAPGPGLKYRAALSISYGAGLHAAEVCNLKIGDIDSDWMAARAKDLLPVEYFHVVFTLPTEIAQIAFWNKKAVYGLLFSASAETVMTIAADPRRLGAKIGMTAVLHTWGSALTHHPHIHMIVPGGGLSPDGNRWIAFKPGFFLHVRVLSRLFRRLLLEGLLALHQAGELSLHGDLAGLADECAFVKWLAPFRKTEWVVYAKPPFGGPEAVLAYLSRYTHRVAISNRRLISADAETEAFRWKDYRIRHGDRQKVMRLATPEFIRRFLIHVLPEGFQRIRHYGLLVGATRKTTIARIRELLGQKPIAQEPQETAEIAPLTLREPCPCCGSPMRIIEIFRRGQKPMSRAPPRNLAA